MAGLSFQDAEKIIRENPKEADALAFASQEYFKSHKEALPSDIPKSVLDGQTISEVYSYLRDQHEDSQMHSDGAVDQSKIPLGLAATPLLAAAFLEKPKIMENDRSYQRIEENLKKEWLRNNPGKDFLSKEGIDYLYGSLDDRTKASLRREAEESFRNNPKFKDRIERYDKEAKKIYKDRRADPKVWTFEHNAQVEAAARFEFQEKNRDKKIKISKEDIGRSQGEIINAVNRKYLREFAQNYPEKTDTYHELLKAEREKLKDRANPRIEISAPTTQRVTFNTPMSASNDVGYFSPPSQPSGADVGRRINSVNNLASKRFKKPFGKINPKIAAKRTLKRGFFAFLVANPIILAVVIVLLLVVFFTSMIVGFGGVPMSIPNDQTNSTLQ
jgi:hypothetical protein